MKNIFRKIISLLENIPGKIVCLKTWMFEWVDIVRKRKLYKDIHWTKQQYAEFDEYWQKSYGKKISSRWHKLYQSINGCFDVTYLPDIIYSTKFEPKINPYKIAKIYQDKSLIEIIARANRVRAPKTILLNSYNIFYDENRNVLLKEEAINLLKKKAEVVIKPTLGGSSGNGIMVLNLQNISTKKLSAILDTYKENYICQEKIIQHPSFAALHPQSINTIRLITVAGPQGVNHWPLAMRIGVGSSCVDNIHAGGVVIGVDDDGNLREKAYALGYCDRKNAYEKHPDTGIFFKGYHLNSIPQMISEAEQLHGNFPGIGMVSWDFTVDKDEKPLVIEANLLGQSIWFPQIVNKKGVGDLMLKTLGKS